jgi:hypothetical protein
MAGKVGLKAAEYSALESGVKSCHSDSLDQVEEVIAKIKALNTMGGGVYLKELTPKINAVIEKLNTAKKSMESVYDAHEAIIKSFQNAIDNYDTMC